MATALQGLTEQLDARIAQTPGAALVEKSAAKAGFNELLPGLTEELEKKLIGLVDDFERESYPTWRFFMRDFLEAESFWKDIQTGFYDHDQDIWRPPTIEELSNIGEAGERFNFVTNFYRAWGWALISVLGQKLPTTRFLATDYRKENDIRAAKAGSDVVPIIERNNRLPLANVRAAYLLYTHGICGAYIRHLQDGQRFGMRKEHRTDMGQAIIASSGYECPRCIEVFPAQEGELNACPQCGGVLSIADFIPAVSSEVPMQTEVEVPRGQEVITLHGGLELRLPPWTPEQSDWPYLGLVNETHASVLKATFGDRAKDVQGGPSVGGNESWDRFARMTLAEPLVSYHSTMNRNLVTVKRYWLRPAAFQMFEEQTDKDALKKLFPDGCMIFYPSSGTKLFDAKPEKLDAHWEVCHAMEGAGNYTPALGSSGISIQKRTNVLYNYIMEWVEYAAAGAGTFVNVGLMSINALKNQRRGPGMLYPIKLPGNASLANAIYESKPGQIAGEIFRHAGELQTTGQQLTGAVPTVSGGTEMSLKPTTYLADREQALGKLYVPWLHLRVFWANTYKKAVVEFAKNRTDDEVYSLWGLEGKITNVDVHLDDLQGDFDAYPEASDAFPNLWHQTQAAFMQLMQSQDPFIQQALGHRKNVAFGKAMLGLPDLYIPGEADELKQELEIKMLLRGAPEMSQGPDGQPQAIPSIPIDVFEDDHHVQAEVVREWAVSPEGMQAKQVNPQGYMNVIAHGKMHEDEAKMKALEAMAPPTANAPAAANPKPTMQAGSPSPLATAESKKNAMAAHMKV